MNSTFSTTNLLSPFGIGPEQIVTEYGLPVPITLSSVPSDHDDNTTTTNSPSAFPDPARPPPTPTPTPTPTFRATAVLLSPTQLQKLLTDPTLSRHIAYIEEDHAIHVDPIDVTIIPSNNMTQIERLQRNDISIEDEDTTNVSVNKA